MGFTLQVSFELMDVKPHSTNLKEKEKFLILVTYKKYFSKFRFIILLKQGFSFNTYFLHLPGIS